ncbi:MAG: hypothetical protein ACYC0V_11195 [Armatimonadota bacterium]
MDETPNRKKCPNCGTLNFLSSETCLQCGTLLPEVDNKRQDQIIPAATPPPTPVEPSAYPPPPKSGESNTFIILGFIFAGLGFCCCPVFAIAGLVMGIIANGKGDRLAVWVIVASSAALLWSIIGLILYFTMGVSAINGAGPFGSPTPHILDPIPQAQPKVL